MFVKRVDSTSSLLYKSPLNNWQSQMWIVIVGENHFENHSFVKRKLFDAKQMPRNKSFYCLLSLHTEISQSHYDQICCQLRNCLNILRKGNLNQKCTLIGSNCSRFWKVPTRRRNLFSPVVAVCLLPMAVSEHPNNETAPLSWKDTAGELLCTEKGNPKYYLQLFHFSSCHFYHYQHYHVSANANTANTYIPSPHSALFWQFNSRTKW